MGMRDFCRRTWTGPILPSPGRGVREGRLEALATTLGLEKGHSEPSVESRLFTGLRACPPFRMTEKSDCARASGKKSGRAPKPRGLFFLAAHPKGEVAGAGAGPELGQLLFELGYFGLQGLAAAAAALRRSTSRRNRVSSPGTPGAQCAFQGGGFVAAAVAPPPRFPSVLSPASRAFTRSCTSLSASGAGCPRPASGHHREIGHYGIQRMVLHMASRGFSPMVLRLAISFNSLLG